ncbi:1,4-dihydroxy-6-naphthoate synthase [Planosporangium sp. 12N6]|uniref:1,4-dihydroxy-6-naphthoate synthase n=1 Tax=Planosporangium spinosum TaxID=3402278 RepID=UPI003CE9F4F0
MTLSLAISPCPNDTFVFHALVHGLVAGAPPVDVTYADVDVTNLAAAQGTYDLVKVSYAALPWLLDKYALLPCGGALGRGCGPLVLVRDPEDTPDLAGRTVAVPGDRTTAYLLMRLWAAGAEPATIEIVPFHEIMPAVAAGKYDAGLVIHEARFTYQRHGLHALADLGEWWERDTGLPIPLGAILARRDSVDAADAAEWVRASVRAAWDDPEATQEYVLAHAQELEPSVASQHIALYVNDFTADLGEEGYAAIEALLERAEAAGLTPPLAGPLR